MAEARQNADWWHTANVLAIIANVNLAKGKPAAMPADFHPFYQKRQNRPILRGKNLEILKYVFCRPPKKT